MTPDYKTLMPNSNFGSATNQTNGNRVRCVAQDFSENAAHGLISQELPTYSVFVCEGEFNDVSNDTTVENNHR